MICTDREAVAVMGKNLHHYCFTNLTVTFCLELDSGIVGPFFFFFVIKFSEFLLFFFLFVLFYFCSVGDHSVQTFCSYGLMQELLLWIQDICLGSHRLETVIVQMNPS